MKQQRYKMITIVVLCARHRQTISSRGEASQLEKHSRTRKIPRSPRRSAGDAENRRQQAIEARKRKKSSHQRNKEEHAVLLDRVRELERELAVVKAGSAKRGVFDRIGAQRELEEKATANARMLRAVRQQRLSVAAVQSMIPNWLGDENPLCSYIYLGRERQQREGMLQTIKEQKLTMACQYCMARSQHLDPLKHHTSDERFESSQGDFCCSRFEVVQFPGVTSIREVYDALRFVRDNLEIIISESLGHITVREDYDCGQDPNTAIANYRLISDDEHGVTLEFNEVSFSQLYREEDGRLCGVVAIDFVDKDELYPYNSQQRIRKDVSVGIVLSTGVQETDGANGQGGADDVVVLRRAVFLKVRRSECGVDEQTLRRVRDGTSRWGELMLDAMRRIVYRSAPPVPSPRTE